MSFNFTKKAVALVAMGLAAAYICFRIKSRKVMMVDTGSVSRRAGPLIDMMPEKDDDGPFPSGGRKRLSYGHSSLRGLRETMEDFYDIKKMKIGGHSVWLFGIFDGHGGSRAAKYLKEHLFDNLLKHPMFLSDTKLAISETYQLTDADFLDSEKVYDGSTATTAVLVDNHLYVANVGDSRTIISKAGKAIALSEDHKPNRSDERKRIENAGGHIEWAEGCWRVEGDLAMSRAFGDRTLKLKKFVIAEPEIQDQEVDEQTELLILASDGLWDVVSNDCAVSLALGEEEPEAAARELTEAAFALCSRDNITCIVVRFHHDKADPAIPDKTASPGVLQE